MSDVLMTREALEAEVLRWRDEAEQQRARAEMAEAERDMAVEELEHANEARDALEEALEDKEDAIGRLAYDLVRARADNDNLRAWLDRAMEPCPHIESKPDPALEGR